MSFNIPVNGVYLK